MTHKEAKLRTAALDFASAVSGRDRMEFEFDRGYASEGDMLAAEADLDEVWNALRAAAITLTKGV